MKIFTGSQIKEIDKYTIENEPINSIDLMERAASKLFAWITEKFGRAHRYVVFVGPGNNGGDGLALARMLALSGYKAEVYALTLNSGVTDNWKVNRQRLEDTGIVHFYSIDDSSNFPVLSEDDVIIDAIFGSGLNRPVSGLTSEIIKMINKSPGSRISIDIPSGLFPEDNGQNDMNSVVMADFTLTFQFPKLAFMFAENYRFTGEWHILDIGLHPEAINKTSSPYYYLEASNIATIIKKRGKFDHKGRFGHGLLIAGSGDKTGAAILASKGALRSGIGLITCHLPAKRINALIASIPEAMVQSDKNENIITSVNNFNDFTAVGVGPGIGTSPETAEMLYELISNCRKPVVLDADALNIISSDEKFKKKIPPNSVLTPHPKEFERLAGTSENSYIRLNKQLSFSSLHNCIIVLKGAHTSISTPDGRVFFNSTGNPGMATAGSGDVLTGMILSFLSQGYLPENAAIAAVYIHGLAGDIAVEIKSYESLIAGDIAENICNAFKELKGKMI